MFTKFVGFVLGLALAVGVTAAWKRADPSHQTIVDVVKPAHSVTQTHSPEHATKH